MIISGENLVVLGYHGRFYTGVGFQGHQKVVVKVSVFLCIPIIVRAINICHKVFVKLVVSFDGLLCRKYFFFKSSHCIETHLDIFV